MLNKIFTYSCENKTITRLILFIIISLGILSAYHVHRDLFPSTELDRVYVSVYYPGSSPEDVELNVVVPIEDKLKGIAGINEYVSVAFEDGARIRIELDEDLVNVQKVKDKIFREMNNLPDLPYEAEMILIEASPKNKAVYTIGLRNKDNSKIGMQELYDFVDQLEAGLLKVEGVSAVKKEGYTEPEVHVFVDPNKLKKYYLSFNEIINSIKAENVRETGGTLQGVSGDKNIVTIGRFQDLLDVKDVIIRSSYDGKRLYLKDVAQVKKGFKEKDVDTRINGAQGVSVRIVKKENADIIRTVNNIKAFLDKNKPLFPKDIVLTTISDESLSITSLLNVVQSNAVIGFVLVFLILFLFLDRKSAFWTAFGIPIIILMVMIYLYSQDMTLNLISLGALITIMGMLVDDGIIVSENIYRYRQMGLSQMEATTRGIKEVVAPVLIAIITTVVAFLPLLFLHGFMGKMIQTFPLIIAVALIASLFEAFFLLPNHLLKGKTNIKTKSRSHWFDPITAQYKKVLRHVIKHRYIVFIIFVFIFVATIFFMTRGIDRFVLAKRTNSDVVIVNMETPMGTSREQTTIAASQIEKLVLENVKKEEFLSIKTSIGHHSKRSFNVEGYHDNWAQINIYLVPATKRDRKAKDIIKLLRTKLTKKVKSQFSLLSFDKKVFGPDFGKGVEVNVISKNQEKSKKLTQEIKGYLKTIPGVSDIEDDASSGKKEIQIIFDKEMLAKSALNVQAVAQTVRTAFHGEIPTNKRVGDKDIDYRVEVSEDYKKDMNFLKNLLVQNKNGNLVRLDQLATFKEMTAPISINHFNGNKAITITGNIDQKITTSKRVMEMVRKKYARSVNQKYSDVYIQFEGEAKETKRSLKELFIAFGLALVFIYFILSLLFKSTIQPLMIIVMVPFGIIGGLLALKIHGMPLSFMAMVGLIGLSGVIVNDNVVLVDYINRIFKEKPYKSKASFIQLITDGASVRLRPVVLTTLTTVLGLLPAVYGIGGTSETIQPIVTVLAYGLLFDTVLTLLFVPSLYMIVQDINRFKAKK